MIYTCGYQRHKVVVLRNLADQLKAKIVDIRINPTSLHPDYRRTKLMAFLGERYISLPEWGNINYKNDEPIKIKDFAKGLEIFKRIEGNTLLMRACLDRATCHRQIIAEMIGGEVLEITAQQWTAAKPVKVKYIQEGLF